MRNLLTDRRKLYVTMKKILITGATGNIGREVVRFLLERQTENAVLAGVRNPDKAKSQFAEDPRLRIIHFDFEDPATHHEALRNIDTVFLLRPPHLSDVKAWFRPLIIKMKERGVRQVVFLSVQGAAKSRIIPHHKIEKLIREAGIQYIFLRPAYFMQNLTTTLKEDIQQKRKIILPAGKAKFNWIDGKNIGEASALLLDRFEEYRNQAMDMTGYENKNFWEVANLINQTLGTSVRYTPVNPLKFYLVKRKEGLSKGMTLVMIMLHFLPRFQKEPKISGHYEQLTGKKPTSLRKFIERERHRLGPQ